MKRSEMLCHIGALPMAIVVLVTPLYADTVVTGDVTPFPWSSSATVFIGSSSNGTLTVDGGTQLTLNYTTVGFHENATGFATITGAGTKWNISSTLNVGAFGNGRLRIEAGAQVTNSYGYLGHWPGGTGETLVTGLGSKWINSQQLYVGDDGSGTLTVADGGEVTANILYASLSDLYGDGSIAVSNGLILDADLSFDATHGIQQAIPFGSGGTLAFTAGGDVFGVGYKSQGTLVITDHKWITCLNGYLGYTAGATGTATVTGPGSVWTISDRLYLGREGGSGVLLVQGGGQLTGSNAIIGHIASKSGGTGSVTITGSGSRWTNTNDLYLGGYGYGGALPASLQDNSLDSLPTTVAAILDGYSGGGTLTVEQGGQVTTGTLYASLEDLYGDGSITATKGALLDADLHFDTSSGSHSAIGFGSGGTLTVHFAEGLLGVGYKDQGSITIVEGVTVTSASGVLGRNYGAIGTATIGGPGSQWKTNTLDVGYFGSGTLRVEAGGLVDTPNGSTIGYYNSGAGVATITGPGSQWTTKGLSIGELGSGSLRVEAGGHVHSSEYSVLSANGPGKGVATITGAGSQWTISGFLNVGQSGDGELTITSGGLVSIDWILNIGDYGDSFINMSTGGMLALSGDADDSLAQFLSLVQGTDAIRYWNASLSDWAPLTQATFGVDYTLQYLTAGELAGYTLLTVGVVPEPASQVLVVCLCVPVMGRRFGCSSGH